MPHHPNKTISKKQKIPDVSCNVLKDKPSLKEDMIHSFHLPQLYPFIMLAYVYIIVLTVGLMSEHGFNVPQRSYGDGDIGLKRWKGKSNVRTPDW